MRVRSGPSGRGESIKQWWMGLAASFLMSNLLVHLHWVYNGTSIETPSSLRICFWRSSPVAPVWWHMLPITLKRPLQCGASWTLPGQNELPHIRWGHHKANRLVEQAGMENHEKEESQFLSWLHFFFPKVNSLAHRICRKFQISFSFRHCFLVMPRRDIPCTCTHELFTDR